MTQTKLIPGPLQEQWLQSLEQHPERQMTSRLGEKYSDGTYRVCCLGEAGLIGGFCKWDGDRLSTVEGDSYLNLFGVYKKFGLRNPQGGALDKVNYKSLGYLNDSGHTWPEIAAIVRANPEQYFTHAV